jgi:DNA-binding CsgD family transcriptional regulator
LISASDTRNGTGKSEKRAATTTVLGRTVAYVQVRSVSERNGADHQNGQVLGRILAAVRSDDHVCPIAPDRIAVSFGRSAGDVTAESLAERIISALAPGESATNDKDAIVAVGVAEASDYIELSVLIDRAMSACGAGWRFVADGESSGSVAVLDLETSSATDLQALRRRIRSRTRPSGAVDSLWWDRRRLVSADSLATQSPSLLVVDGEIGSSARPGLTAGSIAGLASAVGFSVSVRSLDAVKETTWDTGAPDVVMLILDGAATAHSGVSWGSGAWHGSELVTAAAIRPGARVLAIGTGSATGALAACVSRGATALFGINETWAHLRELQAHPTSPGLLVDRLMRIPASHRPAGFDAMVKLTDSERRVLFYLTGGWSAQAIAGELVVSLTTVRSHIRSLLRKLNVRSQIAAVAIANGLEFEGGRGTARSAPRDA